MQPPVWLFAWDAETREAAMGARSNGRCWPAFLHLAARAPGGRLVASPSWRAQALMLGFGHKRVTVDPAAQAALIDRRCFRVLRRRRIPFHAVCAVVYAYFDASFSMPWDWARDTADVFLAAPQLHSGEEVHLFRFVGAGEFSNEGPLPDWCCWEAHLLDTVGTQESESRLCAELLSRLIGVPLESIS